MTALHHSTYNTAHGNMTLDSQHIKLAESEMIPSNIYTSSQESSFDNMDSAFSSYHPHNYMRNMPTEQAFEYSGYFSEGHPGHPLFSAGMVSPSPFPQPQQPQQHHLAGSPEIQHLAHFQSSLSSASGQSATSSALGSPYSNHATIQSSTVPEWPIQGLGLQPAIASYDNGFDFTFGGASIEHEFAYPAIEMNKPIGFVDPSTLYSHGGGPIPSPIQPQDYSQSMYPPPHSPAPSDMSSERSSKRLKSSSHSPFIGGNTFEYQYAAAGASPSPSSPGSSSSKNHCPFPECGKSYKDLKAHILTHQLERPEKCPIATCDYHVKGFARKYDKNRHTLTHYKGTMVCGFCPGSGSAAEKSFNRADVFKRHLMSVHYVEQVPPNARRKNSGSGSTVPKVGGVALNSPGKCSTCSAIFKNAQDFYEHLDDCVLRLVQQEEPSEAINAKRLAEVDNDKDVHDTLKSNNLSTTTSTKTSFSEDEEDIDNDDANDGDYNGRSKKSKSSKNKSVPTKAGRKKRKDYPSSWGCPTQQMKIKKRVLCVFDGTRRLWKDDMMMSSDYEVRCPVGGEDARTGGQQYVTDLDVATMRRAEALHNATEEEKGPWDQQRAVDLEALMK